MVTELFKHSRAAWPKLRPWFQTLALSLMVGLLNLSACGGGVETGGTGSSAQSYTEGTISGFGSIVVNGVHYDESSATVRTEDGTSLSASDLAVGMMVRIDSGAINTSAQTATASQVVIAADLRGPVSANDLSKKQLTVLGQVVQITSATLFGTGLSGGQSAVRKGDVLEIHTVPDPARRQYLARRIDVLSSAPSSYFVRGPVSDLNAEQYRFRMGDAQFVASAATWPAGLKEGSWLKVQTATSTDVQNRWPVQGLLQGRPSAPADGRSVHIEGVVSALELTGEFTLAGQTVTAAAASVSPSGVSLATGMRVEVSGQMQAGVLVASHVEIKDADDDGEDDNGPAVFEFEGRIVLVDRVAGTFTLRNAVIAYGQASFQPSGASEADLVSGARIKAKGKLSTDGTTFIAQSIRLEQD